LTCGSDAAGPGAAREPIRLPGADVVAQQPFLRQER
jgi:hypothetical protein